MKAGESIIEVEVSGPKNESLFYGPLGRRIRGRYELHRATKHDKEASRLVERLSSAIPGQRIGINLETGQGYIVEPLHDEEFTAMRERILKKSRLEPKRQDFAKVDLPTWLYWLKRAVESNLAIVTAGKLPEVIEGEPKLNFYFNRPKGTDQRLAEAIERQTAAIERQSELFGRLLAELVKAKK